MKLNEKQKDYLEILLSYHIDAKTWNDLHEPIQEALWIMRDKNTDDHVVRLVNNYLKYLNSLKGE
jgi:hypothetical protein